MKKNSPVKMKTAIKSSNPAKNEILDGSNDSILSNYIREISDYRSLSPAEEKELAKKAKDGDNDAKKKLIKANLKLVITIAKKAIHMSNLPMIDLIQEGNLELTACVAMLCGNEEVVDYQKAIEHAVRSRLIELVDEELAGTDSVHALLGRVNLLLEATRTLAQEYGRIATIEELSEFTHMDIEEINQYVDLSHNEIELGKGENERK